MTAVTRPSVRAATVQDAAALATIHVRSWREAYAGLLPPDLLGLLDTPDRADRWRRMVRATDWSKAGILVAVPGRELIGFTRFGPTRDADDNVGEVGEMKEVYLLPEAWGIGLGRRLMTTSLSRLAGAGYSQATIWVLATNTRARRFYEFGGWFQDGGTKCDSTLGFPIEQVRYRKQLRQPALELEAS
jgi:GNAT superfamily N-acetyltransferase